MKNVISYIFLLLLTACVSAPHDARIAEFALEMYPDYQDVTIPCNIAPLNFLLRGEYSAVNLHIEGKDHNSINQTCKGHKLVFRNDIWQQIISRHLNDSVEVTDAEIAQDAENQLNSWIQLAGSREKLEEYRKMPISQMREELRTELKNRKIFEMMKEKITGDVTVTPGEVRDYFKDLPQDSLPTVPAQVEVQIITRTPRIPAEEINRIKNELRDYTDRVNNGETSFATLARLYSEDPGSARQGGELGYLSKGDLDPAFDEEVALKVLSADAVTVRCEMNAGNASATAWGCDLTYDYVKINADYRS